MRLVISHSFLQSALESRNRIVRIVGGERVENDRRGDIGVVPVMPRLTMGMAIVGVLGSMRQCTRMQHRRLRRRQR